MEPTVYYFENKREHKRRKSKAFDTETSSFIYTFTLEGGGGMGKEKEKDTKRTTVGYLFCLLRQQKVELERTVQT